MQRDKGKGHGRAGNNGQGWEGRIGKIRCKIKKILTSKPCNMWGKRQKLSSVFNYLIVKLNDM